jgi:hypothetical protein
MTLEERIKEAAIETIGRVLPSIEEWKQRSEMRYFIFISTINCSVLDEVTYDKVNDDFTIKYEVNTKDGGTETRYTRLDGSVTDKFRKTSN